MDPSATIGALDGAKVVGHTENPWGPSGTLGVANLKISRSNMVFDLLVPTSPNDIWDDTFGGRKGNRGQPKRYDSIKWAFRFWEMA